MNRLLLIASDFPPLVGTNTQRIQSFVRHLNDYGWQSTVVTQAIEDFPLIAMSDLDRIAEDVEVIRVEDPDPFATRSRRLGYRTPDWSLNPDSLSHTGNGNAPVAATAPLVRFNPVRLSLSVASGLLKWTLRTFAYQPDALRLWANEVVSQVSIKHVGDKQAILTSSPAFSCHMAGLGIKKRTGLPWVADFRDQWVGRPFRKLPSALHTRWDKHLEAQVVHGCDRLILASPAWAKDFKIRYGNEIERKLVTITNGYEADVLNAARQLSITNPVSQDQKIRFVLTGSMHCGESPIPFIRALGTIRKTNPALAQRAVVMLIGNGGDHIRDIKEAVRRAGMEEQVQFLGLRSNAECIRAQLDSTCLLLFSAAEHVDTILGKSLEYMATGKPIFACIPLKGVQADILREARTAITVEHGDVVGIARALEAFLMEPSLGERPNWEYIQSFDRRVLTQRLATVLDDVSQCS